ncbi:uncharacterized protein LOC143607873 [Bidens hawaiensis]|uniref:uncharacterized protein LOC143607873 n=1 Tax=Bidens hawaiensis TaxID=980011 RepID=UPI0040494309
MNDQPFLIDLLSVELGNFDVIIGMDWLSKYKAEIVCKDKTVRIPLSDDEAIIVQGEKSGNALSHVSHPKVLKYLRQGCMVYLASVTTKNPDEKRIEDIPVEQDCSDIFPDELPGLPPTQQVEFRIDRIPGPAPIAKAPYRLAPSEIQELTNQLQELLDRGFIRPS